MLSLRGPPQIVSSPPFPLIVTSWVERVTITSGPSVPVTVRSVGDPMIVAGLPSHVIGPPEVGEEGVDPVAFVKAPDGVVQAARRTSSGASKERRLALGGDTGFIIADREPGERVIQCGRSGSVPFVEARSPD